MLLMTATNLFSVASYGEFEFGSPESKSATIVVFLGSARCTCSGCGRTGTRLRQPHAHGGFFPNGVGAIFAAVVMVIFSMVGAEVATIAAAETLETRNGRSSRATTRSAAASRSFSSARSSC